mgnify:CR=1 FL=1
MNNAWTQFFVVGELRSCLWMRMRKENGIKQKRKMYLTVEEAVCPKIDAQGGSDLVRIVLDGNLEEVSSKGGRQ